MVIKHEFDIVLVLIVYTNSLSTRTMSRVYKFVLIKYIGLEEVGPDKTKVS